MSGWKFSTKELSKRINLRTMNVYHLKNCKSSPLEVFLGKGVLKRCSKFTAERPCRSAITIKFPVETGCKLNVNKTFRRRPGRLRNVLCTFNLRPVSMGLLCTPFWTTRKTRVSTKKSSTMKVEHCIESVQIRSYFWSVFGHFSCSGRFYFFS